MPSFLPSRFSERQFRRFEPIIATVIKAFPNAVEVDLTEKGVSFETFSCRYRDAITSFLKYGWKSDLNLNFVSLNEAYLKRVTLSAIGKLQIGGTKRRAFSPISTEKVEVVSLPKVLSDQVLASFPDVLKE